MPGFLEQNQVNKRLLIYSKIATGIVFGWKLTQAREERAQRSQTNSGHLGIPLFYEVCCFRIREKLTIIKSTSDRD